MESDPTGLIAQATRVLGLAEEGGVTLRLLGGLAVYFRCPSARSGALARSYEDTDFVGHARQSAAIKGLLQGQGYKPDERFNAVHGGRRMAFSDSSKRRVDVFLDVFEMSHKFDLKERMELDEKTVPLADLLATKLQIVETDEKDMADMLCLFLDHDVGETDQETINGVYIAGLCGRDWGIYKTFTMKLAMLSLVVDKWGLTEAQKDLVLGRVDRLRQVIEEAPKSLGWKVRGILGESVRWYELPEPIELRT